MKVSEGTWNILDKSTPSSSTLSPAFSFFPPLAHSSLLLLLPFLIPPLSSLLSPFTLSSHSLALSLSSRSPSLSSPNSSSHLSHLLHPSPRSLLLPTFKTHYLNYS